MSATTNLDKSLDEIISSKPKTRSNTRKRTSTRGVSKASATTAVTKKKATSKSSAASATPTAPRAKSGASILDEASKLSDRIIISNLPVDVTESAVRDYFSHEVGPISSCSIAYNSRGQSTGVVTITFKRPGDAHKASVRFNGTAIDSGAKRMKVELVMDPSKKPLSTRLNPLTSDVVRAVASKPAPAAKKKTTRRGAKPAGAANGKAAATTADAPKKSGRRPKKTLEELDAEMEDYFDNKA